MENARKKKVHGGVTLEEMNESAREGRIPRPWFPRGGMIAYFTRGKPRAPRTLACSRHKNAIYLGRNGKGQFWREERNSIHAGEIDTHTGFG